MRGRFIYRAWKACFRDQRLEINIARALIRPGDLVIDAGANKGAYLYWLRKFAGESGTVVAYEPQPELAAYLREICQRFRWKNVEIHALALSDRAGKSMLHVPGTGVSPGASLESSVLEKMEGNRFECLLDTLDQQLVNRGGTAFLKVDVEGHELALFRGAVQTLRRDRPALLFECEGRHLSRHTVRDVFTFLQDLGYEGYLLQSTGLLPVERFDPALHQAQSGPRFWDQPGYFNNFLFVANGLPDLLKGRVEA